MVLNQPMTIANFKHVCLSDYPPDDVWTTVQDHQNADPPDQGGPHTPGEGQDEGIRSAGRKI